MYGLHILEKNLRWEDFANRLQLRNVTVKTESSIEFATDLFFPLQTLFAGL